MRIYPALLYDGDVHRWTSRHASRDKGAQPRHLKYLLYDNILAHFHATVDLFC